MVGPKDEGFRAINIVLNRLGSLKQHIGAKLAELKQTIDLRQNQGQAAALAVVQTDRGKQEMDAIRDQVSAMKNEARRDRSAREAACGNG
jgi:CHASE3 domain sensor protein